MITVTERVEEQGVCGLSSAVISSTDLSEVKYLPIVNILGINYYNLLVSEALGNIRNYVMGERQTQVFFLNLNCLRLASQDEVYRTILNRSDLVLSDGIGLKVLTQVAGYKMRDNCNGTDLSPKILQICAEMEQRVFFLGGKPGVAEKAAKEARDFFPGLRVAGAHHGYFEDDTAVVKRINQSQADVLFVGMGSPIQEKWIARNGQHLHAHLMIGVGAYLDYLSGTIPRAPQWMIKFYIEWLWRIGVDPHRLFRRYVVDGLAFLTTAVCHLGLQRLKRHTTSAGNISVKAYSEEQ